MFEFDAGKLIIIGIVALIVIGPKELPRVMRHVGQMAAKMRRMAAEFRGQFMDAMREADLENVKAEAEKLAQNSKIDANVDPLAEIKAEITSALEAADKPALPPPAIAAPGDLDSSLNSIDIPVLPNEAIGGETFVGEGIAPISPEPHEAPAGRAGAEGGKPAFAEALPGHVGQEAPQSSGSEPNKA